jgi:hypothetical protein
MRYADIVEFDAQDFAEYEFSSMLRKGKEIFEHSLPLKGKVQYPAIISSGNADLLRRNIGRASMVRLTTYETDVALIRTAAQKKKPLEIVISDLLYVEGVARARLLRRMRRFVAFCLSYKTPIVITTRARSVYELRSPYEMQLIGQLLGMTPEKARWSTSLENLEGLGVLE